MKTRNTLIWLLILICLAGFVYYYEVIGGEKRRQAEEAAQKVFNLSLEDISEVQLVQKDRKIRCLKTGAGSWDMVDPLQTTADESALKELISKLLEAKQERIIEEKPQDLQPYGLQQPALKITLTSANKNYPLSLGKDTPTGDFLYAKRGGEDKVFLLPADLRRQSDKDVYALRNKQIIKAAASQVSQLRLQYPQQTILLKQDPAKGWQITQPIEAPADNKAVSELLYILDGVQAKRFVEEKTTDLAQYGLDKPRAVIDLTMNDDSHQILLLGKIDGHQAEVYAKRQSREPVFTLPKQAGEFLIKTLFVLRDKKLLYFLPQEVTKLELVNAKQNILLKHNSDNTWVKLKPEPAIADASFIDSLLKTIAKLQAREFIDQPESPKDYGFSKPTLKITLWLKNGSTQSLILGAKLFPGLEQGKAQSELAYAKAKEQITLVEAKAIEQLDKQLDELKRSD